MTIGSVNTGSEFRQETFWVAYVRISIFIPILATLPMYLAKTLTFGDMMQTRTSFARVQDSFGWFTDSYRRLVEWAAVVERLGGFQAALDRVQRQPENACSHSQAVPSPACGGGLGWGQTPDTPADSVSAETAPPPQPSPVPAQEREQRVDGIKGSLKTNEVRFGEAKTSNTSSGEAKTPMQPENRPVLMLNQTTVHTPAGGIMLQAVNLEAAAPEWLLLEGRSGIGKSTLLRVLAGLWPYHGGHFDINGSFLFIPQRPYLPHGSLRDTVSYPHPCRLTDDNLRDILQHIGLGSLKNRLHEAAEWHSRLSGGEQQRLSLARALAARPQILFLDEATNQLDDESALTLMQMLKTELPDTLVVGISHQSGVKALFDCRITLQQAKAA